MVLEAKDVHKSFPGADGPVPVLRGVSLSLKPGDSVALTGESGSGKSTLLHLLGALDSPDRGEITIAGDALGGLDDAGRADIRRRRIGLVFQQFNLIPSLTVAGNLSFPGPSGGARGTGLDLGPRQPPWPLPRSSLSTQSSSRADSNSVSRSVGLWPGDPRFSWPTSPPATSTRTPPQPCST